MIVVRLREDRRFRFGRNEDDESEETVAQERHVTLQRASSSRQRRIRPRSVSWLVILFALVLMAIILLR